MNIEEALQKVLGFGAEDFRKKAIKGGYNGCSPVNRRGMSQDSFVTWIGVSTEGFIDIDIEIILLDPRAWQAVGKVEGWGDEIEMCQICELQGIAYSTSAKRCGCISNNNNYKKMMPRMIDALIELSK